MKLNLLFAVTLLLSLSAFSATKKEELVNKRFTGRVGQLILNAMKSAGVKASSCEKGTCNYIITDFFSADETDGCGGGTTSYETSFKYANKAEYSYHYCEGSGVDGGDDPRKAKQNKGQELVTVAYELDLFQTAGWQSAASVQKIECYTYSQSNGAICTLTMTKESAGN